MSRQSMAASMQAVAPGCANDLHIPVTVSIGAADSMENDVFTSLFKRADEALYQAKKQGKSRVCFHNES